MSHNNGGGHYRGDKANSKLEFATDTRNFVESRDDIAANGRIIIHTDYVLLYTGCLYYMDSVFDFLFIIEI